MTLPTFTDPNPTIEQLWAEQYRLKRQADAMIKDTQLFEIFLKYGELSPIGGSYAYDLMVYPDLDIGLVATDSEKQSFAQLVHDLTMSEHVRKVGTADAVSFPSVHSGRPKGYWIGLEIPFENDRWGVDCWLQRPEWTPSVPDEYVKQLRTLEQSGKDAILLIKYDLIRRGMYGKTIFSGDVYDAVLGKGIRSIEEFNKLDVG